MTVPTIFTQGPSRCRGSAWRSCAAFWPAGWRNAEGPGASRAGPQLTRPSELRAPEPGGPEESTPRRHRQGATAWQRDLVRDDIMLSARTWVVKVGTSVLTGPEGILDPARID